MDEPWTGPTREFAFPVEAGHVLAFRRAIGVADTATGVPPTFAVVADHFDPQFERRPPLGRGWQDGLPPSHLHVEQTFEYARPLHVGETLTARRGRGRVWTRDGRTGLLRFVEERTELFDHRGASIVVVSWVDVHAEQSHVDLTNRQTPRGSGLPSGRSSDHLAGQNDQIVVADHITRTQIVMYVGASGDYHPLHHDDDLAQRNGYPSVFVPGMLTMGLTGKAVTDAEGVDGLRRFGGRFRAQVWPGNTLTTAVDRRERDGTTDVTVTTRNEAGTVVFEGSATSARPSERAP